VALWGSSSYRATVLEGQLEEPALLEQIGDLLNGEHRDERNEHHEDLRANFRTFRRDFLEDRSEMIVSAWAALLRNASSEKLQDRTGSSTAYVILQGEFVAHFNLSALLRFMWPRQEPVSRTFQPAASTSLIR
jgi:hypothetical protein